MSDDYKLKERIEILESINFNLRVQSDLIKEENKKLKKEVEIARNLFESVERVTPIWLPEKCLPEHENEIVALHRFRTNYLEFLELTNSILKKEENEMSDLYKCPNFNGKNVLREKKTKRKYYMQRLWSYS